MPPKITKHKKKVWSEIHQAKYIWLFNFMKKNYEDIEKDTFIELNKRKLMGIIENNPAWGDGSRELLVFMIARYLYNKNNNDRYVKLYSQRGYEYMKTNGKKESNNELDEKEKVNYRDYSYFKSILDNHEKPTTLNAHYKHLLLSMLVLQPPLRTNFYSSASLLETLDRNDHKNNYIYIYRRGKVHAYYFVNKDKASKYKIYSMDKSLSKIEIFNDELAKMLSDSFRDYPRKYLFENKNKKPVGDSTLNAWLRDISGLPAINFDMMRSIYITWFYKNNKTFGPREKLSLMMRHSQGTASKNYLKVFEDEENLTPSQETEKLKKDNLRIEHQNQLLKGEMIKIKMDEGEPVYNKRRGDILYRINKKGVQPRSSTLEKYNIDYNPETKLYA